MAVSFPVVLRDGEGFFWTFDGSGRIVQGRRDEFFSGASISSGFFSASNTSTEMRGRQIVYDAPSSFGLAQTRKVYVSDKEGFVRYLESFTNNGTSEIVRTVTLTSSLRATNPDVLRTSSGDGSFGTDDNWIVRDVTGDAQAAVTHVVAGAFGERPSATSDFSNSLSTSFTLTLAPGETKSILHFFALDTTAARGVQSARSLTGLEGDALRGLRDAELDTIVNFTPFESPQLRYVGKAGPDVLIGDRYDEVFDGKGGDDFIYGDDGNDVIYGGAGRDTLLGGDGDDRIFGGSGNDLVYGGNGNDVIHGDDTGLVTTFATTTIPETRERLSVSMTLPDAANGTTVPVAGFVSRTPVTSSVFNVAFVVDTSGSTTSTFRGNVQVRDLNGDGIANTILDAEIAGFEALLRGITRQVGEENVNLSVISFGSDAATVYAGSAARDANVNGVSDAVEALRSLRASGTTNFEAPLQEAIRFFGREPEGQNLVFFLSDGFRNAGGAFNDEVATLRAANGINATIRSFGVGSAASQRDLDLVDDNRANNSTEIVLDPSRLQRVLIDPGIRKTDVQKVDLFVNGKLATTIQGRDLQETPLGLSFSFTSVLKGLKPNADDAVVARVTASDPDRTQVQTRQIVEVLKEGPGNDRLLGGNGDDIIRGGGGNDQIWGNAGNDLLFGDAGNDRLFGGRGKDVLNGGAGNDRLDGGLGVDRMLGGAGNDTYIVDRAGDVVIEARNQGTDTVFASVDYALPDHVERLVLTGGAVTGTGNGLNNALTGTAGNNVLKGGGGNDTLRGLGGNDRLEGGPGNDKLYGGLGRDVLIGGPGRDEFVFDTRPAPNNVDQIRDFSVVDDQIHLKASIFAGIGGPGQLRAAAFHVGARAADGGDRIIYNRGTGELSYDEDGAGRAAPVVFAVLPTGLALGAADFLVI